MQERWDAIVIGAGLGGMLAGAILARRGKRVLILEREADVGGRLRSYDVDGYVIDAGAYLWPNLHLDRALAAAGADTFSRRRDLRLPPPRVVLGHYGATQTRRTRLRDAAGMWKHSAMPDGRRGAARGARSARRGETGGEGESGWNLTEALPDEDEETHG